MFDEALKKQIQSVISEHHQGVCVKITVLCQSRQYGLEINSLGQLRIRLKEKPYNFKANQALKKYLAKLLGCPQSNIVILFGLKVKHKSILVLNGEMDHLIMCLFKILSN